MGIGSMIGELLQRQQQAEADAEAKEERDRAARYGAPSRVINVGGQTIRLGEGYETTTPQLTPEERAQRRVDKPARGQTIKLSPPRNVFGSSAIRAMEEAGISSPVANIYGQIIGGLVGRMRRDDPIDMTGDTREPPRDADGNIIEPTKAAYPTSYSVQSKRKGETAFVRDKRQRAEGELLSWLSREGVMQGFQARPLIADITKTWNTAKFGPRARPTPTYRPPTPRGWPGPWRRTRRGGGRTSDNFYMRHLR